MDKFQEKYNQGQKYQSERNFEKALDSYLSALEVKKDADTCSLIGVCLFHLERNEEALDYMNLAVELQPEYSYRYSSRAYIKASLGRTEDAIIDYEKCISLDPDDAVAYNNLGLLQEKLGWEMKSKESFKKADELDTILNSAGIDRPQEQSNSTKSEQLKEEESFTPSSINKGEIIKDVFTKKETFKEFISFLKSGFKLPEK